MTVNAELGQSDTLVNYNCQRLKIGSLWWNGTAWEVTQELIGTLTLPDYLKFGGTDRDEAGGTGPKPWLDYPYYVPEQTAWHDGWLGYAKVASGATIEITN